MPTLRSLAIALSGLPFVAQAQAGPTPHPIGPVVARSTLTFVRPPTVVAQSDGRVFVADIGARVVWQLDSALTTPRVVLDSAGGRANTFSSNSFLAPFRGDSALFFDRAAGALVVIDPRGALTRTFAPPAGPGGFSTTFGPGMSGYMLNGGVTTRSGVMEAGPLGSSPAFGMVYRLDGDAPPIPRRPGPGEPTSFQRYDDSMVVMRWHYDTRAIDTVGRLSAGRTYVRVQNVDSARTRSAGNLYAFYDAAVVTSDGSIALFHARDYRIDWVNPDGSRVNGPRIPYGWHRITDAERTHVLDSINGTRRRMYDSMLVKRAADSARGELPTTTRYTNIDGTMVPQKVPAAPPSRPPMIEGEDIPDYYPPTIKGGVLADADNHIWIRQLVPGADRTAPATWDVLDRKGTVIDRVVVPGAEAIVAFGRGGTVYTTQTDAGKQVLVKRRIR